MHGQSGADPPPPPGVVELREDVPLAGLAGRSGGRGGSARCAGGPRLIGGCFAALSVSITLALVSQMYYGEYEVVPHGSVSSSAAECSRAGTDALQAGGRALDAAAAAALCLAVVAPHRTSLDASGSLLYWEYRQGRTQPVELVEWGGESGGGGEGANAKRTPRLVAALAALHAQLGALSWSRVLQPAVQLARTGYNVSEGLADALEARAGVEARGTLRAAPLLARYLAALQRNTSAELSAAWGAPALLRRRSAASTAAGRWRVWAGGAGADTVSRALAVALQSPSPGDRADVEAVRSRAVTALQAESSARPWSPSSVASGLAVVDRLDTYAALVTGVSQPFGSGPESGDGWTVDEPSAPLDLAPAILTEERVCGTRFVVGAESTVALAQAASALAAEGAPAAVERARVPVWPGEGQGEGRGGAGNASLNAAVNVVRQRGDTLASHADSRGGGHASRF